MTIRALVASYLKDPSVLYSNRVLDKIVTGVRQILAETVNADGTAMLAKVVINEPMGSKKGLVLVDKMRRLIGEGDAVDGFDTAGTAPQGRRKGMTVSLGGQDAEMADLVALIDS